VLKVSKEAVRPISRYSLEQKESNYISTLLVMMTSFLAREALTSWGWHSLMALTLFTPR